MFGDETPDGVREVVFAYNSFTDGVGVAVVCCGRGEEEGVVEGFVGEEGEEGCFGGVEVERVGCVG